MSLFHLGLLALSYLSGCNQPRPEDSNVPDDTSDPELDCFDADGDGYFAGTECNQQVSKQSDLDCDDGDCSINPGADEVCEDDVDNDCDDRVDEYCEDTGDTDDTGDPVDVCEGATGVLLSETPRLSLFGESASSVFGDVQVTGDFNCDGVDDLALGDQYWTDDVTGRGRVYVLFGGADSVFANGGALADANVVINPYVVSLGQRLGASLAAEDMDNDGCDDLLMGLGEVRILEGSRTLGGEYDSSALPMLTGAFNSDQWGLKALGDIDGDGWPEVAVEESDGTKIFDKYGEQAHITTSFPYSRNPHVDAMTGGDINGDGFSDLVMALGSDAPAYSGVYVLMGGANVSGDITLPLPGETLAGQTIYMFQTESAADSFQNVFADDYDGDGLTDLAFSAVREDNGHTDSGVAFLLRGASFVSADFESGEEVVLGLIDPTYNGATDVYGDIEDARIADMLTFMRDDECGFGNLVLGSSQYATGATVFNMTDYTLANAGTRKDEGDAGEMTVDVADQRFTGRSYTRVLAGDFDGDGVDDLIFGAPSENRIDFHVGERQYE